MKFLSYILLMLWSLKGLALSDSSIVVSKNFKFKDGVYLSLEDFKNNTPSYDWEELNVTMFSNPQTFMAQLAAISILSDEKGALSERTIDPHTLWGLSIGGIPYVRLPEGAVKNQLATFAGLKVRGRICFFTYAGTQKRKIPMPVYNPATGRPFRVAYIEREEDMTFEKMLNFESGQIADFTLANFKAWISNDRKLLKSIEEMSESEAQQKLFKCLLIYDDRHELRIKSR